MLNMKKRFHVFFLFALFAFFAVNAAWARQVTLSIDPYTGDRFINISKDSNDPDTLAIPSNVTTFKVYDDGGKDGNYSYGYYRLTLTTSESNKLYMNGFAWLENSTSSYIYIYDGGTSDNVENARVYDRLSSGNSIMIYLGKSNSGLAGRAGFDFSVTVIPPRSVSVKSVSGGSAVSNKSSACYRDTITLSATPNTGYFLKEVTLKDDAGYKMNVDVNVDWLSGTAKFVMPDMNTNVYPVFSNNVTAENGFYLNMPSYTYNQTVQQTIDIPEGTVSFKVYDDGGKDGDYSHPGESYLQLTAPAKGERFRITGFVQTNESHARLTIYDGKKGTTALLKQKYSPTSAAEMTDIGTIVSSKNIVTLYFAAYNFESAAGLDLKVEVLQGISISKAENGSVTTDKNVAEAGEKVTLTPNPEDVFGLSSLVVTDAGGNVVSTTELANGTFTFNMPRSGGVTVTPTFVRIPKVTIVQPSYGTVEVITAVFPGKKVELQLTSNYGYCFSNFHDYLSVTLDDDGSKIATDTDYRSYVQFFTMPDGDITVTVNDAAFSLAPRIYIENVPNGSIVSDKDCACNGAGFTLTATPNEGYVFRGVKITDDDNNPIASVTQIKWYSNEVYYSNSSHNNSNSTPNNFHVTPVFETNLTAEDLVSLTMPTSDVTKYDLSSGIKSFKVLSHTYKNKEGSLVLSVPDGYLLQVDIVMKSTLTSSPYGGYQNYLTIYDGDVTQYGDIADVPQLWHETAYGSKSGTVQSSENSITVHFKTGSSIEGNFTLRVKLVEPSYGAVAIAKASDGKIHATIEGAYSGDESLKIMEEITVDNVELNREFSTNGQGFSTIVLPFDFNAAALTGVKSVIEFTGMTKNGDVGMSYIWCSEEVQENIRKKAEADGEGENYDHCNTDKANFPGDMIAYTPYMVQMEDAQIGFGDVGGVTLKVTPDVAQARVGDWVFRGTTENKVFDAEETKDGNIWGFAAKVQDAAKYVGQFVRLGEGASAQPLRAYMVFDPVSSDPSAQLVKSSKNASFAAKPSKANSIAGAETAALPDNIDVVIVSRSDNNEEHRTVIGTLTRSTGEFKMRRDYDLKGRKVNATNKAKGAYYGKKVLKK